MSPFLTDLDSRAAVKGSRDPLGIQPIWSRLGRHIVGNLTTVSTSLRDFTTLVLGYYFAERVSNETKTDDELATFLKWEQLSAYVRGKINGDWVFRGVDRVKKNLQDSSLILLSADSNAQILSNQKTYGLWGLYTVASRSSGLVDGAPTRLTPAGRDLVERIYLPTLTKAGFKNADALVKLLAQQKVRLELTGRERPLFEAIGKVLQKRISAAEREIFNFHLLRGGPHDKTNGAQELLVSAMVRTLDDPNWTFTPARIHKLAESCRSGRGPGENVADRLERIRTNELLMAPAAALFDFLLGSDGQTLTDVAGAIRKQWGRALATIDLDETKALEPELQSITNDAGAGTRWLRVAQTLAAGEYEDALGLLIDQNKFVMNARSGAAAWVEIRENKIQVRFRDDEIQSLPGKADLPSYWRHSYFLDALRSVALALRE